MNTLLSVSIALLAGLLMTRAFKPFKLPSVTAYLIAGVLIGPYAIGSLNIQNLGFNSMESVEALAVISEIALGFIAFSIGSEFKLEELKHIGKHLSQPEAIRLYLIQLESSIQTTREEEKEKKKLYQSMGILVGIFLVLVLI